MATSGPLDPARVEHGVRLLESWGLAVDVGATAAARDPVFSFLAGTDEQRAADLQAAWCSPRVRAVFVGRGGSGAARLLDRLDWAAMRAAGPKLLVGFSDVTVLHEAVAHHLGLVSLLGPMPATAALGVPRPEASTAEHLRRTLFEPESTQVLLDGVTDCIQPGAVEGVLVGGTLALLASTVGTPESRRVYGGIAVLEDVAEPAYRLDNRLTQLLRTGWFEGVRGVVLGSWTDCGDGAAETVAARLRPLGIPIVAGAPFGHCAPALTVPLGVAARLDAAAGTLILSEPCLRPRP